MVALVCSTSFLTTFEWEPWGRGCSDSISHKLASPESRGPKPHIFHNHFNACSIIYFTVNGSKLSLEVKGCLWLKMDNFLHCDNKMRSPENVELLFFFCSHVNKINIYFKPRLFTEHHTWWKEWQIQWMYSIFLSHTANTCESFTDDDRWHQTMTVKVLGQEALYSAGGGIIFYVRFILVSSIRVGESSFF